MQKEWNLCREREEDEEEEDEEEEVGLVPRIYGLLRNNKCQRPEAEAGGGAAIFRWLETGKKSERRRPGCGVSVEGDGRVYTRAEA
ncbi:hypothetical protein EYF80_052342 [Liparis tanakae]|uniref:Uncharacterized protein n=1 Tax=Liparis tanakae TaxID=230148 RepID=A0A4Z2F8E2_9TELE|nr:hypothetical protein EYF80_052342 [Liparis tanakae]